MSDRKPLSAATVRKARMWLRALRDEAQAREDYANTDEPRARERARKRWLSARAEFGKLPLPSDEALQQARQK